MFVQGLKLSVLRNAALVYHSGLDVFLVQVFRHLLLEVDPVVDTLLTFVVHRCRI